MAEVKLEPSWKAALQPEFERPYFTELVTFLRAEKATGQVVYPPGPLIFNAFALTPLNQVKVVLLGQDPYHGLGQAEGLSFSVPEGVRPPPSLQNIFTELVSDMGIAKPTTGHLTPWAQQGVLLLNSLLTVRAGQPGSHKGKGWEQFTNAVLQHLNEARQGLVFLLWGKFAQEKAALLDASRHLLLQAAHPSPYSAHNGFFGCRHFSKTNLYLANHGLSTIEWHLP